MNTDNRNNDLWQSETRGCAAGDFGLQLRRCQTRGIDAYT
jgi:hypothetical protein